VLEVEIIFYLFSFFQLTIRGDNMVKVKKKSGTLEEFMKVKIVSVCQRAGATAKEAGGVAEDVSKKVVKKTMVTSEEIGKMVVDSLKKVNKAAADTFAKFKK